MAQTVLRLLRQRSFHVRVERRKGAEPILHVEPQALLTDYLRAAIRLCRLELVAIIEKENT
jgi:hypothetical protein